jgi:hypothetical protein
MKLVDHGQHRQPPRRSNSHQGWYPLIVHFHQDKIIESSRPCQIRRSIVLHRICARKEPSEEGMEASTCRLPTTPSTISKLPARRTIFYGIFHRRPTRVPMGLKPLYLLPIGLKPQWPKFSLVAQTQGTKTSLMTSKFSIPIGPLIFVKWQTYSNALRVNGFTVNPRKWACAVHSRLNGLAIISLFTPRLSTGFRHKHTETGVAFGTVLSSSRRPRGQRKRPVAPGKAQTRTP